MLWRAFGLCVMICRLDCLRHLFANLPFKEEEEEEPMAKNKSLLLLQKALRSLGQP